MSSLFGMRMKHFNFTATVQNASDSTVADLTARNDDVLNIVDYRPQWEEVAEPLISTWAERFDSAFPPIDPAYREAWATFNQTGSTIADYHEAVEKKRKSV